MTETTITKDDIKNVLESLGEKIDKEHAELYQALIEKTGFDVPSKPTVKEFYFGLVYPYTGKFLPGLINKEISTNSDVGFILINSQFIESHFRHLISDVEGHTCCADKSRVIMNRLLDFYRDGTKIEFDYTQKYTYHLPKTIFKTHEDIVSFYEGLRSLYYGNPEAYLKELAKVVCPMKTGETGNTEHPGSGDTVRIIL